MSLIGFGVVIFIIVYQQSVAEEYFENYYDEIDSNNDSPESRNAIRWNIQKWPDKIIPYSYTENYTPAQQETVDQALRYFNDNTCIKFEKRNYTQGVINQRMVVFTTKDNYCGTKVGYQLMTTSPHFVYMSPICLSIPGAIQHETMHVMGIFHEQSRSDRDQYIDIDWSNIHMKNYHNFIKVPVEYAKPYDTPYDYGSIMHYSEYAFARDPRKPSMRVHSGKTNPYSRLGQLNKPSELDLRKINLMYECV